MRAPGLRQGESIAILHGAAVAARAEDAGHLYDGVRALHVALHVSSPMAPRRAHGRRHGTLGPLRVSTGPIGRVQAGIFCRWCACRPLTTRFGRLPSDSRWTAVFVRHRLRARRASSSRSIVVAVVERRSVASAHAPIVSQRLPSSSSASSSSSRALSRPATSSRRVSSSHPLYLDFDEFSVYGRWLKMYVEISAGTRAKARKHGRLLSAAEARAALELRLANDEPLLLRPLPCTRSLSRLPRRCTLTHVFDVHRRPASAYSQARHVLLPRISKEPLVSRP